MFCSAGGQRRAEVQVEAQVVVGEGERQVARRDAERALDRGLERLDGHRRRALQRGPRVLQPVDERDQVGDAAVEQRQVGAEEREPSMVVR